MYDTKKELAVVALSTSESNPGNYALILEETETRRRIPMIIGAAEAQAIAITMEQMKPARPLTHDLFKNTLAALEVELVEVLIHSLVDQIFHASLLLKKNDGTQLTIDSRASDAIAMAVRFNAPIYTFQFVVEEAGILADVFFANNKKGSLAEYSLPELEELLERVLAKEDYESAARIRDLIERRRGV